MLLDDKPNDNDIATRIEHRRTALTPAEFADLLSLSQKQTYSLIKRGWIPSIRIASSIRLDQVSTAKWLRSVTHRDNCWACSKPGIRAGFSFLYNLDFLLPNRGRCGIRVTIWAVFTKSA